ncbi:MAG: alkaline phosphatase family protein [Actinomycetaceae bacterium]|nr:alkaline phosphatase family protein [Actinomycetaceae bacterium]
MGDNPHSFVTDLTKRPRIFDIMGSALAAVGAAHGPNNLDFPKARQVVFVLVDGMGYNQLSARRGHIPFLRGRLGPDALGYTCAPSTTAAAITSFTTGQEPSRTKMVGYEVVHAGERLNLITFAGHEDLPERWQSQPTWFERIHDPVAFVGLPKYAGSGLTRAALRGTTQVCAPDLESSIDAAVTLVRGGTKVLYLYWAKLDHIGHHYGWKSSQWTSELERIDAALADLARRLPTSTLLVITADHGMVDTQSWKRFDVRAHGLMDGVTALGGEPRALHLHTNDPECGRRWQQILGERALVESNENSLLGQVPDQVAGQFRVWMRENWVGIDPLTHSPGARALVGVHGSLTAAEIEIPIISELV